MTYQGERARPMANENGRSFQVTKVRMGADGQVSEVLWGEVDAASDGDVGPQVLAPVEEAIDAIHDGAQVEAMFTAPGDHDHGKHRPPRAFVVVEHANGVERIAFEGPASPGRELPDMERLDA